MFNFGALDSAQTIVHTNQIYWNKKLLAFKLQNTLYVSTQNEVISINLRIYFPSGIYKFKFPYTPAPNFFFTCHSVESFTLIEIIEELLTI